MALKNLTFKRGVHIPEYKELSCDAAVFNANTPKIVTIPLSMHIGAPAKCIVKKNDEVKVGQLIGEANGNFSANIYSSVSGVVKNIETVQTIGSKTSEAVVIETDGLNTIGYEPKDIDGSKLSPEEIVEKIKEAGIVGMGGAGFPTHIKYTPQKPVDTIIVNGAECEPYVTSDDALMKLKPENIVKGLELEMKAVGAKRGIIAIEDNKKEATEKIKNAVENLKINGIEVYNLITKYPQGDEKRLIDACLNREVPSGALPADVGAIVSNASTTNAIFEACYLNKPLYERYITVTGHAVKEPHNLLVPIGTHIIDLINQCGGLNTEVGKVISGGPMMGIAQQSFDTPVEKATNSILVMTEEESRVEKINPCIRCARCVSVCPVGLLPLYIHKFSLQKDFDKASSFNIMDCIECGSCSFVCPSNRPLVEAIRFGKREIKASGK
ncbi:MAG: electron transport complex subunit RsxC [Peptoniphilaceae bacterium]|nr:electron transport complex subunit RsxC [Peptoniphilaceae bacterium]MDD7383332.1 electron transport complex subunit RsxC [Peptoniphilaceae bacterium]MDY3738297.1 electron transport complex subunit RsxC [Peptoniphilaceae bacterium]